MAKNGTNEAMALDVATWLARKHEEKATIDDVLPSGLAVKRYQKISIEKMVTSGKLPLTLLSELGETDAEGQMVIDRAEAGKKFLADPSKYMELFDALFVASIAEPVIGDETDIANGRLALSLFDEELRDKLYIVNKVMGGVNALQTFRENGA